VKGRKPNLGRVFVVRGGKDQAGQGHQWQGVKNAWHIFGKRC